MNVSDAADLTQLDETKWGRDFVVERESMGFLCWCTVAVMDLGRGWIWLSTRFGYAETDDVIGDPFVASHTSFGLNWAEHGHFDQGWDEFVPVGRTRGRHCFVCVCQFFYVLSNRRRPAQFARDFSKRIPEFELGKSVASKQTNNTGTGAGAGCLCMASGWISLSVPSLLLYAQ